MTSRFARWLAALSLGLGLVFATLVCATGTAVAQTKEEIAEARAHYQKGLELYEEGAYDAALIEFQRAYDTAPTYKILYNIGLVYRQLNDYAGSLRTFKKYLEEGGKKVDARRRAEVEREIDKLQGRVASVKLTTNVEGATVLVDDLEVGETPLDAPLTVNAGRRKISLTKSGYAPAARVLRVAGGDERELELELRPSSGAGASPPAPPPTAPAKPSQPEQPEPEAEGSKLPWLPWAVTGALAAGTAVAGVLTLSAESDLESEKDSVTTRAELDDAESKTRTLAIVTDVLLAATVVSAGISLYITLDSGSSEPAEKESAGRTLRLGVGPGTLQVSGTF